MQTETTHPELSLDVLRSLAFMQYNDEPYFIFNGKAYEGDEKELNEEWIEATENLPNAQTWEEFIEDKEITDYDNDDYLVLTDEEADEKVADYIKDSVWAFNASFIACHCSADIDEEMIQMWQEKCEGANDGLLRLIDDIDEFIEDAVSSDGRGHFMSSYDGHEHEETVKGITCEDDGEDSHTFYIYRQN